MLDKTFIASDFQGVIQANDEGGLTISPKRRLKNLGRKSVIPEEFIRDNIKVLNSYYQRKSLGKFSYDKRDGVFIISFEPNTDKRPVGAFLSSTRDPLKQILAGSKLSNAKETSKQEAFVLFQALELLKDTQHKQILAPVNPLDQGISVFFDSNFEAQQFFDKFTALHKAAADLVIDLGLVGQRSTDVTNFFRINFSPNWGSELYLNSDKWYTDENMSLVEAVFNVRVPEELI